MVLAAHCLATHAASLLVLQQMHLECIDCMSSISADNLSKMFCNNLGRRPWFFVLPPTPNESIPKIRPSQTILSLTSFIEHDHTNADQIKKRPTGPLCKLNPCILSYLTITN